MIKNNPQTVIDHIHLIAFPVGFQKLLLLRTAETEDPAVIIEQRLVQDLLHISPVVKRTVHLLQILFVRRLFLQKFRHLRDAPHRCDLFVVPVFQELCLHRPDLYGDPAVCHHISHRLLLCDLFQDLSGIPGMVFFVLRIQALDL